MSVRHRPENHFSFQQSDANVQLKSAYISFTTVGINAFAEFCIRDVNNEF